MWYRVTGLMGLGLLFLNGCAVVGSSQVDPSAFYSTYRASFDEESQALEYKAVFQVGGIWGTYIELDDGSEVRVDSVLMTPEKSIFNDIAYVAKARKASAGELAKTHVFALKNVKCRDAASCPEGGEVVQNSIRIPGRISIPERQSKNVPRSSSFRVEWESVDRIQGSEEVYAVIRQKGPRGNDCEASAYASSPNGVSGVIDFSLRDYNCFLSSKAELSLCRKDRRSLDQGSEYGGELIGEYCSKKVNIAID